MKQKKYEIRKKNQKPSSSLISMYSKKWLYHLLLVSSQNESRR